MTQKQEIEHIRKTLEKQSRLLERLTIAVCGDEELGHSGLIQQVTTNSEYIDKDKTFKNKVIGAVTAITSIWGVGITLFLKFWKS
jgi:hypothetical protein